MGLSQFDSQGRLRMYGASDGADMVATAVSTDGVAGRLYSWAESMRFADVGSGHVMRGSFRACKTLSKTKRQSGTE
jgi:hypothetical protein